MSGIKQTKPLQTINSFHVQDEKVVLEFLKANGKAAGSLKNLGAFIENLKIRNEFGIKAKIDLLIIERKEYQDESPGEQYTRIDGTTPEIFEFAYNLPDDFPNKTTSAVKSVMLTTIKTYACVPKEKCSKCSGSGNCTNCDGRGYNRCSTCNGSGNTQQRSGNYPDGKPKYIKVKCYSCHGAGTKSCMVCKGTKKCVRCDGSGEMTCKRCQGTGRVQTYNGFSTCYYTITVPFNYSQFPEVIEALKKSKNKISFDSKLIEWENEDTVKFDKKENALKVNTHSVEFINSLKSLAGLNSNQRLGRVHTTFENVPITILDYTFENKEYSMFIVGENNIICYNDIPQRHLYSPKAFTRLKNFFNKKKRKIGFLYIASYIFYSDDIIDVEEVKFFETFLKKVKLNQEARNQLIKKLKQKNSLDSILPFIKCLRNDKRALVFGWQCVMRDNQINEKEIVAFNELASVFKTKEAEKEMIKNIAKQFRDLPYEQMIEEYFI